MPQETKHSRSASRDYQCSLTEVLGMNLLKPIANTSRDFPWCSTNPEPRQLLSTGTAPLTSGTSVGRCWWTAGGHLTSLVGHNLWQNLIVGIMVKIFREGKSGDVSVFSPASVKYIWVGKSSQNQIHRQVCSSSLCFQSLMNGRTKACSHCSLELGVFLSHGLRN